ncbi:MAG: hypothetical protein R2991_05445 [Thermoanaerobaculia bacterium]
MCRRGRPVLLAALVAVVGALVASLLTGGRLGGWPLAVVGVGVLPFLLMAWGADPPAGGPRRARTAILVLGALWVTGCLAAVFVLADAETAWTLFGLPAQLAVLLALLALVPLLLLGLGHAWTFGDDAEGPEGTDLPRHGSGG